MSLEHCDVTAQLRSTMSDMPKLRGWVAQFTFVPSGSARRSCDVLPLATGAVAAGKRPPPSGMETDQCLAARLSGVLGEGRLIAVEQTYVHSTPAV